MTPRMSSRTPRIRVRELEKAPYVVDDIKRERFSRKRTIFERVMSDPSWKGYMSMYDEKVPEIVKEGRNGYSRIDFALSYASWIVHDAFKGGFSHTKIRTFKTPLATIGIDWGRTKLTGDTREMKMYVKRAAKLFGVSLIGICKLDRNWLYAEANIPKRLENVIVMAVEMDPNGIATSPAVPAAAATGIGYSKMAFVLACMGEFIRNLGYRAVQCGNDSALSIPLAIDAGLGELGRNGLLITPQFGPRIRLCKIFTDLPLESDMPIEFGVEKFCRKCKQCAKNCKANAISSDDEPSFEVACRSNNSGTLKWYVNSELCYQFWCENGIDCSTCISVCPYGMASAGKARVLPREFWKTAHSTHDILHTRA